MNRSNLSLFGIILLTAMLSSSMSFFLFHWSSSAPAIALAEPERQLIHQPVKHAQPKLNQSPSLEVPQSFADIAEQVTPAVVNITGYRGKYPVSGGSGVIISDDGYLVTNYHVIEAFSKIEVKLYDKRNYEARLIGVDPTTDLALLKIQETDLPFLHFADSDSLRVGEWVLAVGNPFNLTSTVTAGIVSAKARNISILREAYSIESFIQTDAVVNPGNSGGALVNTRGQLVGINAAIMSENGSYEGYSFAIPGNLVNKVVSDLRDYGSVRRALLGVTITDVSPKQAKDLDLPSIAGAYIQSFSPGSAARQAGLKVGDVIVQINDRMVRSVPELQEQVARFSPGDEIAIWFYRKGRLQVAEGVPLKGLEETSTGLSSGK